MPFFGNASVKVDCASRLIALGSTDQFRSLRTDIIIWKIDSDLCFQSINCARNPCSRLDKIELIKLLQKFFERQHQKLWKFCLFYLAHVIPKTLYTHP